VSLTLIGIFEVIVQFKLSGIAGDKPGGKVVGAAGEIVVCEFDSVVEAAQAIVFLSPGGEVPVYRFYVR